MIPHPFPLSMMAMQIYPWCRLSIFSRREIGPVTPPLLKEVNMLLTSQFIIRKTKINCMGLTSWLFVITFTIACITLILNRVLFDVI